MFLSVSTASLAGKPEFEVKTTIEGQTDFTMLDQFIRPDLTQRLNVGVTACADWGSAAPICLINGDETATEMTWT